MSLQEPVKLVRLPAQARTPDIVWLTRALDGAGRLAAATALKIRVVCAGSRIRAAALTCACVFYECFVVRVAAAFRLHLHDKLYRSMQKAADSFRAGAADLDMVLIGFAHLRKRSGSLALFEILDIWGGSRRTCPLLARSACLR